MYLKANEQFKAYLKQEISQANCNIVKLYIRHLEDIIQFSPIESDIDVLARLKSYDNLTYSALKQTVLQTFSPIFKAIILKHDEQFKGKCYFQIKTLLDLERLYSFYVDSSRFFNDFDTLEKHLSALALPMQEEFCIFNYYINCTFNFIVNEGMISTKEGIEAYLNISKERYDEVSFLQLKEYLKSAISTDSYESMKRNFEVVYPLVNSKFDGNKTKYSISDLYRLKLNITLYQMILLSSLDLDRNFDFAMLSYELKDSEPEDPSLKGVQSRLLIKPNSD